MSPRTLVPALVVGVTAALMAAIMPPWAAALVVIGAVLLVAAIANDERTQPVAPVERPRPIEPPPRASPSTNTRDLSLILDALEEGVLLLDAQQNVIAANTAAGRILGRPREAMVGVSLIRAAWDYGLVEALRAADERLREVVIGDDQIVGARTFPVDHGAIRRVVTLQDLTALRNAQRARHELVGNVSHELRTPIAAALALAETLDAGVDDEAQRRRFHDQLISEIERLGRIVERLLRLSRIESGTEEFHAEDIPAIELLEEARRRMMPVADQKSIRIECTAPDALAVHADRERILEVLANLLDNAIRHSPEGETVILTAAVDGGDGGDGAMATVGVQDRGPGILPRDRLRIFERFYTGDRARGEREGTGLGLAIARHIVSRHGGEIWVADHTPGTLMRFTLPRAQAA